ncbi:MAG: hypothetical protein CL920_13480 [Deltaproteobacteria bacterium]|nr:hypothetical protein [Deltaproteobacteria bacterium]MBU49701.1 hypothetical protein [Deltaproteobacteria bacterium]
MGCLFHCQEYFPDAAMFCRDSLLEKRRAGFGVSFDGGTKKANRLGEKKSRKHNDMFPAF